MSQAPTAPDQVCRCLCPAGHSSSSCHDECTCKVGSASGSDLAALSAIPALLMQVLSSIACWALLHLHLSLAEKTVGSAGMPA